MLTRFQRNFRHTVNSDW